MKPCKNCGGTNRNPSGGCRPCSIARSTQWQKDNREKANAKSKKWKSEHRKSLRPNAKTIDERIERRRAAQARYQLSNREKISFNYHKRKADNPEKELARLRKWKADHPEQMKASRAKYWADRPDARRVYKQNRRAKEADNGGTLSPDIVKRLFKLQRGRCACCGQSLGLDYHLDHVLPVVLGGQSANHNMQLLRKHCNLKKNSKHPIDFMQSLGFLL